MLLDEWLGVARSKFRNDPPAVAAPSNLVVGMLDPDNGDPFPPRLLDEAADVGDNLVALHCSLDDAVLHVDDEEGGVRPVLESAHGFPLDAGLIRLGAPAAVVLGIDRL
jgi:hypothetical protein